VHYPNVLSESETLDRVLAGASLARYGDGEFNLCEGHGLKCQRFDLDLARRLREILIDSGECLVGIPNIRSRTPKLPFWSKYLSRAPRLLTDRVYGSSFVTRPDSAPWVDTPDYWRRVESLWVGQRVTLVRGQTSSLTPDDLKGAAHVDDVIGPRAHAWSDYTELLSLIGRPARALLCLGPTATVMAVDLCAKGVHAIDLGHIGLFYRKHLAGEPMIRTDADKILMSPA
jgi:hypothetical protein